MLNDVLKRRTMNWKTVSVSTRWITNFFVSCRCFSLSLSCCLFRFALIPRCFAFRQQSAEFREFTLASVAVSLASDDVDTRSHQFVKLRGLANRRPVIRVVIYFPPTALVGLLYGCHGVVCIYKYRRWIASDVFRRLPRHWVHFLISKTDLATCQNRFQQTQWPEIKNWNSFFSLFCWRDAT